jgi:hypothetical protein
MEAKTELTLLQFYTQSTCGEACWEAREDVCHCSCGGKNHGILRHGGDRPERTRKVKQYRYTLHGIVNGWREAKSETARLNETVPGFDPYRWNPDGDAGDPYITQRAGKSALNWQEVEPFVNEAEIKDNYELYVMYHNVHLIWRRSDITPAL